MKNYLVTLLLLVPNRKVVKEVVAANNVDAIEFAQRSCGCATQVLNVSI